MQVLHSHWHVPTAPGESGGLLIWAENSQVPTPKAVKGRRGKAARLHPFCASVETVAVLVETVYSRLISFPTQQYTLWLPTVADNPQPSPRLIHDWEPPDNGQPELAPWLVTGLWLEPFHAFQLLTNLPDDQNLPTHLAIGDEVRYWQTAATLVLETLAQQKILPTLVTAGKKGESFEARWMPVLDGPHDGPRLAQLLAAMPALCRAEAKKPEEALPPRIVLDTFLNSLVDTLARQWSKGSKPISRSLQSEPAEGWLEALFENTAKVSGSTGQLGHLSQGYRAWLRNLQVAGDKTFRIAFRLEAPLQRAGSEEEPKDWQLHYLLQARDDPSLLVPAQQVWRTKRSVLQTLNRRFEQPQEKLLAGLGYAARLYEPLKRSLKTATPTNLTLTTDEAFGFLRDTAPLLEAGGFGILVPPWWNKPGMRFGVRLKLAPRQKAGTTETTTSRMTLDNLIHYQWELSVGDTPLSQEEFQALVALKSPLVQIRGQWVQLDAEQIEAAIRFWEQQQLAGEVDLQQALQMGLDTSEKIGGLPVEDVEFEGWFKEWMERFTGQEQLSVLPQPDNLQATLRPYQAYGYSWLDFFRRWNLGACLADDMGLGKTIQTIAMLLKVKEETGQLPGPVLLICPTSVVANWDREIKRFAPDLSTLVHQGPDRLKGDAFQEEAAAVDMVLTSYALARRDAEMLQARNWFTVILDEAQNIKNPQAQQTRAIRQIPNVFRLALTGTPVENRLSELWSIMQFLNPGFLGPQRRFRQNFGLPIERYHDQEATERLKKMVSPFILRRVKTDPTVIQDLPDKLEMKVYCNLGEEQATLYQAVVGDAMQRIAEAEGIERRGLVLGMLMKLKQICNHPAQFLHQIGDGAEANGHQAISRSGKLTRLVEMLDETISVGDRILIFTQFAEMGQFLKGQLQHELGVPVQFLHGGTPAKQRTVMVNRFQEDPNGPPIFLLSLKAGGTGLNLTRANHVFHFDRWWNPAVENQATDRAFRIGQKRNVQVHKFVCVGTMEEMVDDMIESKKALADQVVGSGEDWLTEISTNDLRDMVTLRREALA